MMTKMFAIIINQIILFIVFNNFIANIVECNDQNIVTVRINSHIINGKRVTTVDGKQLNVFKAIPYAEPPLGELRFRKPVPLKQWPKQIDAFLAPNSCIQNIQMATQMDPLTRANYSEDCLYLNIWSPADTHNSNVLKPVIFQLHPGGLLVGSSSQVIFQGSVIAAKGDVVFVSINYRLGLFGFLYTGTEEAPGNVGLWDQALALKWVNDNIQHFGGDPQQITLFGQSSGSWSVSLHILSPVTRNLFKNAIMNSGAILNKVIDENPETSLKKWLKGAELIGCRDGGNVKFTQTIIQCLRAKRPEDIDRVLYLPELSTRSLKIITLVVFDGQFIPKSPDLMLSEGDFKKNFSLLFSSVEDEGSPFLTMYDPIKYHPTIGSKFTLAEAVNELNEIASNIMPNKTINGEEVAKVYFNGLSDSNDYKLLKSTIGIAFGDYYLTCPTLSFAKQLVRNSQNTTNVYQYHYNRVMPGAYNLISWTQIHHGADWFPIFGIPLLAKNRFTNEDKKFTELMIQLITSFAKTGVPMSFNGGNWPKYYMIKDNVIAPYYEMTTQPKPNTQYGLGFKLTECEHLWKQYY